MNSLLDYGSSSSDTDAESENEEKPNMETKSKLPKPSLGSNQSSVNNSVFSNPFVQAELAKAAILEKHVKMVPGKDHVQMINGKKICWNFRKGRCRFGHNCKYAHDTDIQKSADELDADKQKTKTIVCESSGTVNNAPSQDELRNTTDSPWEGTTDKRKLKRPGLSQQLVPGKKVIKMYNEQKLKDAIKQ